MPLSATAYLLVGLGGLAGSMSRYGLSLAVQRWSIDWPVGTLGANLLGCFLMGILTEISASGEVLSLEARLLLAVGFCGGFTTISSMVFEAAQMIRASEYFHFSVYVGGTLIGSLAAFFAGLFLVIIMIKLGSGIWN